MRRKKEPRFFNTTGPWYPVFFCMLFLISRFMGSHKALGLSVVDFRRTFPPGDAHDAPIALDGPTQVMMQTGK